MNKFTSGVVLASVAGRAVATVCPTSVYSDSNLFDNLVVAAVIDASLSGVGNSGTPLPGGKKATAALLATALGNLTGMTVPVKNNALVNALTAGNSCGTCAYSFYSGVYTSFIPNVYYACTVAPATAGPYAAATTYADWNGKTVNSVLNALTEFQALPCISIIQQQIDAFNACANNGYDIRTGALSTICATQDDFINVDAQYGAYKIMMDWALRDNLSTSKPMSADFVAAYTALPCRSCFDSFIAAVNGQRASLWGAGLPCVSGAGPYVGEYYDMSTGRCVESSSIVSGLLNQFQVCAGTYNALYKQQRFPPSADDAALYNEIFKAFQPIAACGAAHDAGALVSYESISTNEASIAGSGDWGNCVTSSNGGSPVLETIQLNDLGCFQDFAHRIYGDSANAKIHCAATTGNGPFTSQCLLDIAANSTNPVPASFIPSSANSDLMNFYKCSGIKLDTSSTAGTVAEIASVDPIYKSYIPMVEAALASSGDVVGAGKKILADTDLMGAISDLPFESCYARMASELASSMAHNDIALCENPYSLECKGSTSVVAALASFKTCSGFSATNVSPDQCTDAEWAILQSSDLVHEAFELIVPNNTQTLLQAQYQYELLMNAIGAANPTLPFRCDDCFHTLLTDFSALEDADIELCDADITSAECYSAATIPLAKFQACSGHAFEWAAETTTAAPVVTTTAAPVTTTAAPATTTTAAPDTTVAPTTTKSSTSMSLVLGGAVAILAVLL